MALKYGFRFDNELWGRRIEVMIGEVSSCDLKGYYVYQILVYLILIDCDIVTRLIMHTVWLERALEN